MIAFQEKINQVLSAIILNKRINQPQSSHHIKQTILIILQKMNIRVIKI